MPREKKTVIIDVYREKGEQVIAYLASKITVINDNGTVAKQTNDNLTEKLNATHIPITNVEIA